MAAKHRIDVGPTQLNPAEEAYQKGVALFKERKFAEAEECFKEAVALSPTAVPALINLGNCAEATGRYPLAIASYERALGLQPLLPEAYNNLAAVYHKMDNVGSALACIERSLALAPFNKNARWNRASFNLATGMFADGWEDFDARFWRHDARDKLRPTPPAYYEGQPIPRNKKIVVWAEQGLGECICYASMIKDFERAIGAEVVIAVPRSLIKAFQRSFPGSDVREEGPQSAHDCLYQIPMGSLGKYVRRSFADFRSRNPFLVAPQDLPDFRKEHPGKMIVGVSWKSANDIFGEDKSMNLEDLDAILKIPGIVWVDLQYGDTATEVGDARQRTGATIIGQTDNAYRSQDLDPWLARVKACDVVLTISNVTAHAAGAMGVRTLLMLPRGMSNLWHWFRVRSDSPWYGSVTIVRQQRSPTPSREWFADDVLPVVEGALRELVADPPLRDDERLADAILNEEIKVLEAAKRPDTPENFEKLYGEFVPKVVEAARPFLRPVIWPVAGPFRVGFYIPSPVMLAHVVNLLTYLKAYKVRYPDGGPIRPIIYTTAIRNEEFAKAFGEVAEIRECGAKTMFQHWRLVKAAAEKDRLSAFVHISTVAGMAWAATVRIAPKHVWWSMKWHGADVPGVDAYIDGCHPYGGDRMEIAGRTWACIHQSFPEVVVPDGIGGPPLARVAYGTLCREEKLTPEYAAAVGRILADVPGSAFYYTARQKPEWFEQEIMKAGVAQDQIRCLGWLPENKTVVWANSFDVFLDTFPFQCGHTAVEAMACGKPVAWMDTRYTGEQSVSGIFDAAGPLRIGEGKPFVATSVDSYICYAAVLGRNHSIAAREGQRNRRLYDGVLRDLDATVDSITKTLVDVILSETHFSKDRRCQDQP